MPDIEKRLEAFVRIAHGIIIFPGGVGTAEELLYLLGILMHPDNKAQVLPLILTGPKESADYFRVLDEFITHTLGESARRHYRIIIDDPAEVARQMKKAMPLVKESRRETDDAYSFNWPPTCAAPSPALSQVTSKRWASRPSSSTVHTSCTATRR